MNKICGIVLYNPELNRLRDNIEAILPQVDQLLIVDNGSSSDSFLSLCTDSRIEVIRFERNMGIATAQNAILQYALDHGYEWALTLDQDSVSPPELVDTYFDVLKGKENVGIVCCRIHDRNASLKRNDTEVAHTDGYIDSCISSASMINVEAWRSIGGFDDAMFIDSVDFDYCHRLRKASWLIFRTNRTELLHEVGHSKVIKIFGKEYLALNHSPFRYYYILRNAIYQGRKFNALIRSLLLVARMYYTVLFYEHSKCDKLSRMNKGFLDGFRMQITKHTPRCKQI